MKKIASIFADFRTIYLGIIILLSGAAWAGDARWMKKEDGVKIVTIITLSRLQERAEELEIQRGWETDPVKIKVLDSLIKIKRSRIDVIIKAQQIH